MSSLQRLIDGETLSCQELARLIQHCFTDSQNALFAKAREVCRQQYGNAVYVRGLIEFTNFCRQDCRYCGIRKSNSDCRRYRLSKQQILDCCKVGAELGIQTFVLQGGEDPAYSPEQIAEIVRFIKAEFAGCAVTLSFGERSKQDYRLWKQAGADRYLLRHETANEQHYRLLHPPTMSLSNRMRCLKELKALGYQVGAGFMVGSPGQTFQTLAEDLMFLRELKPHMVGIGPFVPHRCTPFADHPAGSLELTLCMLALVRLMLPKVLLPSTTALATIAPDGRELGILAGGNVVMPNLTPADEKERYLLYNHKAGVHTGAAEAIEQLKRQMEEIGYYLSFDRGDSKMPAADS